MTHGRGWEPTAFPALPLYSSSQCPHETLGVAPAPPGQSVRCPLGSPGVLPAPGTKRMNPAIPNYPGSHPSGGASSLINKCLGTMGHPAFPPTPALFIPDGISSPGRTLRTGSRFSKAIKPRCSFRWKRCTPGDFPPRGDPNPWDPAPLGPPHRAWGGPGSRDPSAPPASGCHCPHGNGRAAKKYSTKEERS